MKKHLYIICCILTINLFGQKPSNKDAKDIFTKTIDFVRTSDTMGFKNIHVSDTLVYADKSEQNFQDAMAYLDCFYDLKSHLAEVITKNIKPKITVRPLIKSDNSKSTSTDLFEINADFKINKTNTKSVSFVTKYINKKLTIIDGCTLGTSTETIE